MSKLLLLILALISLPCRAESVALKQNISPWISIEIGENTQSFLVALESEDDTSLYVADLIDPDGKPFIVSNVGAPSSARIPPYLYSSISSANRTTHVTKGLGSALIPNNDLMNKVTPGTWKMRVGSVGMAKNIYYWIDESKGQNSEEVTFEVLLDKESLALTTSDLDNVLANVRALYARYEIKVDFDLSLKDFALTGPFTLDAFTEEAQRGRQGRPIINLVRANNPLGKKDFQGLAGCLPFFISRYVDRHCAIGIAFHDGWNLNQERLAKVIAHEVAHFFGLFHLSDDYYPFGNVFDPISDTDSSIELTNVMHKTSEFYDLIEFTAGQVKVMKRHPMLTK